MKEGSLGCSMGTFDIRFRQDGILRPDPTVGKEETGKPHGRPLNLSGASIAAPPA